jgi:3-methyladenine DNA glycosylase AlkD
VEPLERADDLVEELDAVAERRTAPLRAVRRQYTRRIADRPAGFVLDMARAILDTGRYRWIAYELIAEHQAAFRSLDRPTLEELGAGIDSWDTVDPFARTLSGPAWLEGLIEIETIQDWARSDDRWWRRAALVSTVALNMRSHGGYGDVERTLAICRMLPDDEDDMVVKALSWALRSLVVHDPEAVRTFLRRHGGVLAARVKREVTNKLETGLKNP